jgi:hypothetical protein
MLHNWMSFLSDFEIVTFIFEIEWNFIINIYTVSFGQLNTDNFFIGILITLVCFVQRHIKEANPYSTVKIPIGKQL